jgi:hypothetical protein
MKNKFAGVVIFVAALLFVGCSASEGTPQRPEVSHPCPEAQMHVHRVSPKLDPVLIQGVIKAVDEWGVIIGSSHPQSIVITDEASEANVACITSWLYSDDLPGNAFGVTEAGKVHITRSALPDGIKLQLPLHEMGHVLGLGDSKIKDSVMWKFIGPGQPITCQDKKDVCQLQSCNPGC